MKTYNGGSISNLLKNINNNSMYVTDTPNNAIRYANAQATGVVSAEYGPQAANTVLLEVECKPNFLRRSSDHHTLDVCESFVRDAVVTKATIKFDDYGNTLYGNRHSGGYKRADEVVSLLESRGIEVEVI